MPKYLGRHPIGFSQRSGMKVRHSDLVDDGEIRGLRVKRGEEDQEHPQKRLKPVGADKINLYRPQPENYKAGVTFLLGWEAGTNFWEGKAGIDSLNISVGYVQLVFGTDTETIGYGEGGYSDEGYDGFDVDQVTTVVVG